MLFTSFSEIVGKKGAQKEGGREGAKMRGFKGMRGKLPYLARGVFLCVFNTIKDTHRIAIINGIIKIKQRRKQTKKKIKKRKRSSIDLIFARAWFIWRMLQ